MDPIFAVGNFDRVEVDGLETFGSVTQQPGRVEAQAGIGAEQIQAVLASVRGGEDGPACLHQNSFAAFQTEQGHAEILHVEGPLWINLAPAPVCLAEAAWAKLRLSLRGHRTHLEILKQVQARVEQMQPEITGAATAGKLFLSEP